MQTTEYLLQVLASTYVLQVKTQNFHWNYVGPHFPSYHAFFEEQYDELSEAVDVLAERIRQLGTLVQGRMADFITHSVISEVDAQTDPKTMIALLRDDHKKVSGLLEEIIGHDDIDEGTKDLLIERQQAHDKHHWMLASTAV